MSEPCPECGGKCCRDDLGYRVAHYGAELYEHVCEACLDGDKYVPPRTYEQGVAEATERIVAYLRYQAEVFADDERPLCRAAADIEQGEHVGWAKKEKP